MKPKSDAPGGYTHFWYFLLFTRACLGDEAVVIVHEQVGVIILGTIFLFIGVAACCIAAIRGRRAGRNLPWFGVFSAMYGVRLFAEVPAAFSLLAGPFWRYAPQLVWIITYVILIPALLFWAELSLGTLRRFLQLMVFPASVITLAGIFAIFHGSPQRFLPYANVLAICLLVVVAVANVVPRIGKKYLVIQSRVAAIGTLILAAAVIYENSRTFLNLREYPFLEPVAFTLFVFSQGWIAAERVFADERRLLSIENELAIAREIQTSILPRGVPELERPAHQRRILSDDRGRWRFLLVYRCRPQPGWLPGRRCLGTRRSCRSDCLDDQGGDAVGGALRR